MYRTLISSSFFRNPEVWSWKDQYLDFCRHHQEKKSWTSKDVRGKEESSLPSRQSTVQQDKSRRISVYFIMVSKVSKNADVACTTVGSFSLLWWCSLFRAFEKVVSTVHYLPSHMNGHYISKQGGNRHTRAFNLWRPIAVHSAHDHVPHTAV